MTGLTCAGNGNWGRRFGLALLLLGGSALLWAQRPPAGAGAEVTPDPAPPQAIIINPYVNWRASGWAAPNNAELAAMQAHGPAPRFIVAEPNRRRVWVKYLDIPIPVQRYPIVVIRYRASNTTPKSEGYLLWLDDGTGPDHGGMVTHDSADVVADGQVHEVARDLRQHNPKGDVTGMALGVACGPTAPATFELLGLRFEAPPDGAANPAPAEDAPVTVAVVDPAGQPIASVRVTVDAERSNWARSAVTDETGQVTLKPLANDKGRHMVRVIKDGMTTVELPDLAKAQPQPPTVTLWPAETCSISGRVSDDKSAAAAGAAVLLRYSGNGLYYEDFAVADAEGRYEFPLVGPGQFRCSSVQPAAQQQPTSQPVATITLRPRDLRADSDLLGRSLSFAAARGRITKDLLLARACNIAGQVVDVTSAQPVPGLRMNLYVQTEGQQYLDAINLVTDQQGKFRAQVPPGSTVFVQWDQRQDEYLLDSQWRDASSFYQPLRLERIASDRMDLVLKVKLRPVHALSGRVVDDKGQGVKDARVHFLPESTPPVTDAGGAFTLRIAPRDADFDLCAVTADRKLAGVLHVKAGDASEAIIRLAPTRTFKGQVQTPDGQPAENLSFYLDPMMSGTRNYQLQQQAKADAEGRFSLENLIPDLTYMANWSSNNETNRDYDYGEAKIELAKLKKGEPIRIEARQYLNSIIGKVVNEKGEPVAGARIEAGSSELLPQDLRFGSGNPILSDAKGEFVIQRLAAGEIALRLSAEGYKTTTAKTATDAVDLKVALEPSSTPSHASITVVDQDGRAMPDVPVTLVWYDRAKPTGGAAPDATRTTQRSDRDGRMVFPVPAATTGKYIAGLVYCDIEGRDIAFGQVLPNEDTDLSLKLLPSAEHWRGIVRDEAGRPLGGATIRISSATTDPTDPRSWVQFPEALAAELHTVATTDNDGRFEISRLGRLPMNLHITMRGYAGTDQFFAPSAGDLSTAAGEREFTLLPGVPIKARIVLDPPPHAGSVPNEDECHIYFENTSSPEGRVTPGRIARDWSISSDDVKPGPYRVILLLRQKDLRKYVCPSPPTFEAVLGKPVDLLIRMEEGIPLRGKLLRGGRPVEGVVTAIRTDNAPAPAPTAGTQADPDGSWELYLASEGEYRLQYYLRDGQTRAEGNLPNPIKARKGEATDPIVIETGTMAEGR